MNTVLEEGVELASQINDLLKEKKANCEVVICVPFTHLVSVNGVIDAPIKLGAENCSEHEKGAYTGEVSAAMVKSTGASHVILGHSERRQYFGENNEQLLAKTKLALANNLTPIFCVGEVLEERENGSYNDVVKGQVEALFSLSADDFSKIVIAYEPVWQSAQAKLLQQNRHRTCTHIFAASLLRNMEKILQRIHQYYMVDLASLEMQKNSLLNLMLTEVLLVEQLFRQTRSWA